MKTQQWLTGMVVLFLAGALSVAGADRKVATAELKDANPAKKLTLRVPFLEDTILQTDGL